MSLLPQRGLAGLLAGLVLSLAVQAAPADEAARFVAWLQGEWNNNEQVWQQKIDAADPKAQRPVEGPVEHLHTLMVAVPAPPSLAALPGAPSVQWVYLQQSAGADPADLRRQWMLRLSTVDAAAAAAGAVRQDVFSFVDGSRWRDAHRRPQAFAALTLDDLKPLPECAASWRFDAAQQSFSASGGRCLEALSSQVLATHEAGGQAPAMRSRKVRYYEGWVWFRNAGPGAAADDSDTSFTAKLRLHNEGQRLVLLRKDGTPSPWMLELALLTYQNTRRPVLKLALLDRQTLKSISYTWTQPDGSTLGINLGWFQAGVTVKAERVNFAD